MTSRLSSNLSLLGEILFISNSTNNIQPDVERLVMQYRTSPYFSFGIGRFHSSIGYYNTTFHQGSGFRLPSDGRLCMSSMTLAVLCPCKRWHHNQRPSPLGKAGNALRRGSGKRTRALDRQ